MSPASGEHWVTWCAWKKDTVLQKEKTCGQAGGLLEKSLMDGWNQNRTLSLAWGLSLKRTLFIFGWTIPLRILSHLWNMVVVVSWLESQENVGRAARQQPKHTSYSTKERLSQSPDFAPNKILWKDLSRQFIGGNPPTSQSLGASVLRNGLKLLHVIVQDWLVTAAKAGHRYWKQMFTYICNAQICNIGSF